MRQGYAHDVEFEFEFDRNAVIGTPFVSVPNLYRFSHSYVLPWHVTVASSYEALQAFSGKRETTFINQIAIMIS